MSNKVIKIDINDPGSISKALEEVKAYRQMIVDGSRALVDKLSDIAVTSASDSYAMAPYAGDNDVSVSCQRAGDLQATISATGNATLFIEFGTGINKADAPEARADLKSGTVVGHGQYGHHLGRLKDGWRYVGSIGSNPPGDTQIITEGDHKGSVHTYGNDAVPAMYMAKKQASNKLPELVKEVFK